MPRTPLFAALQNAAREVGAEVAATAVERLEVSRRTLLKGSMAGLGGAGLIGLAAAPGAAAAPKPPPATRPRIVVIGAGLAGLTAAYQLKRAGHEATVYEAATRLGGRCWTDRTTFAGGQLAERGGEMIDQGHTAIRQLIQNLGLNTTNLLTAEPAGSGPLYYFDGAAYTYTAAKADLQAIWQPLHNDVSAASYPTLYNNFTPRGQALDRMSIRQWIVNYVPGGIGSKLGQLLDVAYNIEYGAETTEQAALNLIYLLGYQGQGNVRLFGKSNEKYRVVGGNDQIVTRLAAAIPGQIQPGTALRALARNGDGTWAVTVGPAGGTGRSTTVTADRVVLALPFSLLRQVDLTRAGFPALKTTAINELRMGTNSKLQLQFTRRYWNERGGNGDSYSDTGYQATWDGTRGQAGTTGILVDYTGGTIGAGFGSQTPTQYAQRFLTQLQPVLPGISPLWNGLVSLDYWTGDPWARGSYSYWSVGQYTRFAGVEREAVGSCHFAGEHTSVDFQGYLNGAVETGQRAAAEVLAAIR